MQKNFTLSNHRSYRMKKYPALILLIILSIMFFSWHSEAKDSKALEQKVVQAVRINEPIVIDGFLSEGVWNGSGYNDFIQSDPIDGGTPTEKTTVWIAYDNEALYVAARLFDSEPELILSRLERRDNFGESDWFIFAIDPYYDHRTGFQFAVNPSGCIVDWTLFNDEWKSNTWDGVWSCSTHRNNEGWTVEVKIPFNQLRFPKKEEHVWGVNFQRIIKRKNEKVSFVWIPKEESGYVSRFAKLVGIKGIRPGRHIELLPYSVGSAQFRPKEPGNPFETGKNFLGNLGLDMKIGLKSNLTLDATINPDFGQVEVDPAVINLSDYETYYAEKRPFFIEGKDIFNTFGQGGINNNVNINWDSPSMFYSRRIGRQPQGYVSNDGHVSFPDRTTILGAFKLTGKLGSDWNIGFINAFTAREYAEIDWNGNHLEEEVEPFSYYGVLRAQKEFNGGAQSIGFISTSVIRDLRTETLSNLLSNRAFSLAVDGWTFLDKDRVWVISGWFGSTYIEGNETTILNIQKSSLHYFQRPDSSHVTLDPDATILSGWGGRFVLNKQKGNFLCNVAIGALSPGFDPNDAGFQYGVSDVINGHVVIGYRQPQPGKILRSWMVAAAPFRSYDFGGNKTWDGYLAIISAEFLNYWGIETMYAYNPETISNTLTRGGPLALIHSGRQINFSSYSDSRKPIILSIFSSHYLRPTQGFSWSGGFSLRWKPRSNFSISFGPDYSFRNSKIQWVTKVIDPFMTETFGNRYVFGKIQQRTLSSEIRVNWTFTPKMTLQLYLQPFLAIGQYDQFRELAKPKSPLYNIYGEGASTISYANDIYTIDPDGTGPSKAFAFSNPNFNVKSLRGTMVLRWEYLPGSLLYVVWTQNRADYTHPGDFDFSRDMGDLLTAPGDNIFLIKFSYRWNM